MGAVRLSSLKAGYLSRVKGGGVVLGGGIRVYYCRQSGTWFPLEDGNFAWPGAGLRRGGGNEWDLQTGISQP